MTHRRNRVFVGVDWGTSSSKTICRRRDGYFFPHQPIFSSNLVHNHNRLTFAPNDDYSEPQSKPLKEILIQDPLGQPFWDSDRLDIDASLGDAIAFSLCCLLVDAIDRLPLDSAIELGFSFPNWLADPTEETLAAASNYRDAVAVAIELYAENPTDKLPHPGNSFPLRQWKEMVTNTRRNMSAYLNELPKFDVTNMTRVSFERAALSWGFLVESGAAGLPYLKRMNLEEVHGLPGFAKVLVVDVGAGSTDVGYMVHSQRKETSDATFYYFPPASSFPEAGNTLTKDLRKYFAARGERMTLQEAEARKLVDRSWIDAPFAGAWRRRIAEHIATYVEGIPDDLWLPKAVSLNIVLTGGSGLVSRLKEDVNEAVNRALKARKTAQATIRKTIVASGRIPGLKLADEVKIAQCAVAIGASDSDRPGFKYIERNEGAPRMTYRATRT